MPRPRKPTSLHVVENTYRPGRHAERDGEPDVSEPIGGPPKGWKPDGKLLWWEVVNAVPAGVVTKVDRLIVELLVRLIVSMRETGTTPALASQVRACLASLGMTPADRSRVKAADKGQSPDDDEFFS